jgi:hypothetical protein
MSKNSEVRQGLERSFERKALNFAFETGMQLEVSGLQTFIRTDEREELLCIADDPKHLWRTTWQAMTVQFPTVNRYTSTGAGKNF